MIAILMMLLISPMGVIQTPTEAQDASGNDGGDMYHPLDFFISEIPDSAGEGFEPHILAGPSVSGEEWIYIDSPTGIGGGQSGNLWISKDHGGSWGSHAYGRNALGSGDSFTAIAGDGTIYYTDLYLWSSTIDTSKDGGETWIRNPLATVTRVGDRQWLDRGPTVGTFPGAQAESLYMIYNDIPQGLVIQRAQWTTRGFIWTMGNNRIPVSTNVGSRDHFCVDKVDGTIYLPNKEGNNIAVYVSKDGADSFTRYEVLSTDEDVQNIFIASDVDMEGNVYLTWSTQENVFMAVSTDRGAQWNIQQVTDTNGTRVFPWITVGDPGRVALTWYETTEELDLSSDEKKNASWGIYAAITEDGLSDNSSFIITPILDYVHTGSIRTTGTGGSSDRDLGDFFTCDVDDYGRLIVTFGMDGDDGPDARRSVVMYTHQLEGPFLKIGVGPQAIFENETDELKVSVDASRSYDQSGVGIADYLWDFGDGTNSSGIRAEHTYQAPGTYDIRLKVVNKLDMRDTATGKVEMTGKEGGGGNILLIIILPMALIGIGIGLYLMIRNRSKKTQGTT